MEEKGVLRAFVNNFKRCDTPSISLYDLQVILITNLPAAVA